MAKESEFSKLKKGIAKEEVKLAGEIKKEERGALWFFKSLTFKLILTIVLFVLLIWSTLYLGSAQGRISIDKSEINAPIISLSPATGGVLEKIFVTEGQLIPEDMVVAQVNGQQIKSKIAGLVVAVQNTPGQIVNAQSPVVQMIDPSELKVIGHIEENKGLANIKVGQKVVFTVDAFGSKQYNGYVSSISPTSRASDLVFSISDKRQEQVFDVKVKFNVDAYPELKNGMSAKMWITK